MKSKLDQVLERHLNGREIALWGTPTRLLQRQLKPYKYHIADIVDTKKHYVIPVTEDDLADFLTDEQSKPFKYVADYYAFENLGRWLPFEWTCYTANIGRQSYFGERVIKACKYDSIERIGHFTSINSTASIHCDHPFNMVFMSDDIIEIFNDENKALHESRVLADPKNPYSANKANKLIIGNDVWVGSYAFINCSKVRSIDDGAIIGAGAIVLEDVPPYAVVVGVPAKIKRYRFSPEMVETLLRVKWWDWSIDEINVNADALFSPEIFYERFGNQQVGGNGNRH